MNSNDNSTHPKGIVIMKSYYDAINQLDKDDRLIFYEAIMNYGFNGTEPTFEKKYLHGYWNLIQPTLSKGISTYLSKVNNGKKGGLAKAKSSLPTTPSIESTTQPSEAERILTTWETELIKILSTKGLSSQDEEFIKSFILGGIIKTIEQLEKEISDLGKL